MRDHRYNCYNRLVESAGDSPASIAVVRKMLNCGV